MNVFYNFACLRKLRIRVQRTNRHTSRRAAARSFTRAREVCTARRGWTPTTERRAVLTYATLHSISRVLTLRLYASRHFFINTSFTLARSGPPQRNVDPGRPGRPFQPGSGRFQAKNKPILVQSSHVLHLQN